MAVSDDSDIRERLLDAAAQVFAERGYDGTRVGDVARRAGLSTGAIYSRFQNKSDLLMSALVERATTRYDDTVARLRTMPYEESLLGTAQAFLRLDEPLLLDALAAAQRDEALADRLRADVRSQEQGSIAFVEAAQAAGQAPGDLSPAALARFSTVLRIGAHALARLRVDPIPDQELNALSQRLVEALVYVDGNESAEPLP